MNARLWRRQACKIISARQLQRVAAAICGREADVAHMRVRLHRGDDVMEAREAPAKDAVVLAHQHVGRLTQLQAVLYGQRKACACKEGAGRTGEEGAGLRWRAPCRGTCAADQQQTPPPHTHFNADSAPHSPTLCSTRTQTRHLHARVAAKRGVRLEKVKRSTLSRTLRKLERAQLCAASYLPWAGNVPWCVRNRSTRKLVRPLRAPILVMAAWYCSYGATISGEIFPFLVCALLAIT
mmetsp:Transcript_322/g.846  ORF Transcript_322/g.846 Transcript_322/m.846 type:complete len:238 (-) Transcript_322:458-1171(-)